MLDEKERGATRREKNEKMARGRGLVLRSAQVPFAPVDGDHASRHLDLHHYMGHTFLQDRQGCQMDVENFHQHHSSQPHLLLRLQVHMIGKRNDSLARRSVKHLYTRARRRTRMRKHTRRKCRFAIPVLSTIQRAILHLLDATRRGSRAHDAILSLDGLLLRHQRHRPSNNRDRGPRLPEGSFQTAMNDDDDDDDDDVDDNEKP